jgi:16S rRNA (cytidine1402-2'-O)-methyltransferase
MSIYPGTLYVVATPIGNLEDLSPRAAAILEQVDVIAAEDTRHSRKLLDRYGIRTPLCSYHDRNESAAAVKLLEKLRRGRSVALISDAGTPLISDPGFRIVDLAHQHAIPVRAVPGPSALIAALSVSGLPAHHFIFEGFAPEKATARLKRLQELSAESRTLVFFETPHRIRAFLADAVSAFGPDRQATIVRELTKQFETVRRDSIGALRDWLESDPMHGKGEFVVVFRGAPEADTQHMDEVEGMLRVLLRFLSAKDAAAVIAELTGARKNEVYRMAVERGGKVKREK